MTSISLDASARRWKVMARSSRAAMASLSCALQADGGSLLGDRQDLLDTVLGVGAGRQEGAVEPEGLVGGGGIGRS